MTLRKLLLLAEVSGDLLHCVLSFVFLRFTNLTNLNIKYRTFIVTFLN